MHGRIGIAARSCFAAGLLLAALSTAHAVTPQISAGNSHSVALHSDGTVSTWGNDRYGQLGGRAVKYTRPVQVSGIGDVQAVSVGSAHVLALKKDGTVWAWGENDQGQLGDGTFNPSATPTQVAGLPRIVAVAAGAAFNLALASDGHVWAWGANFAGQLGGPTSPPNWQTHPIQVPALANVIAISAGEWHGLALGGDGSVWSWGHNDRGQLGDGTNNDHTPGKVAGLTDAIAISAGQRGSFVLRSDGTVWGAGAATGLCVGNSVDRLSFVATQFTQARTLSAGSFLTLAIQANGTTVQSCGDNFYGQLGIGAIGAGYTNNVVSVAGLGLPFGPQFVSVCAARDHAMVLRSDGRVFAWGSNADGQLGNGSSLGNKELYPVSVAIDKAVAIACGAAAENYVSGSGVSFAVKADGTLWMFGNNLDGVAGNGVAVHRTYPAKVPGIDQVTSISAGSVFTLAARADGTVWTWGGGVSQPAPIAGISNATAVCAGGSNTLVLRGDGTVYSSQPGGISGPGNFAVVPGLNDVTGIADGSAHSAALRSDGTVWTWGDNRYGQLGDGTTTSRTNPAPVPGLSDVTAISTTGFFTLALKRDGTVWGWGWNGFHQLGDDAASMHLMPAPIANLSDVKAISAGAGSSLAIKSDGSIWTFGYGYAGIVRVGGTLTADAISLGGGHALAMKRDGVLWAWGNNYDGELGNGTLASSSTPVVVIADDGAGSIEGGDWFLDLDPSIPSSVTAESVPSFLLLASGDPSSAVAYLKFRARDVGTNGSVYVFARTPATTKDLKDAAPCQLAQLDPSGQLVAVTTSTLQPAVTGVLEAAGQSVSILNTVSTNQYAGTTFFVGYGSTSSAMFDTGTDRRAVSVGDDSACSGTTSTATAAANAGPLSGLWWNAGESGWGVDFTHRRNVIFAAWYTYDAGGNPKWYVASNCTMPASGTTSGTCNGALYEVNGPTFFGGAFNPTAVNVVTAGSLSVNFASASNASLTYTVGSQTRTVNVTRQIFATGTTFGVDYTDLWWNPSESGWGIAITQQANLMFLAWYVYDSSGKPVWYVASNCAVSGSGCTGTLYRTIGPAFGPSFDSTKIQVFPVGTATLSFTDANNGTLSYTVDGVSGTKTITRQVF